MINLSKAILKATECPQRSVSRQHFIALFAEATKDRNMYLGVAIGTDQKFRYSENIWAARKDRMVALKGWMHEIARSPPQEIAT